jgi:hypothetical protein
MVPSPAGLPSGARWPSWPCSRCSGERPTSRDKLLALLWPDQDAERARHNLADAVYLIRKALGEESVLSLGDDLLISRSGSGAMPASFSTTWAKATWREPSPCTPVPSWTASTSRIRGSSSTGWRPSGSGSSGPISGPWRIGPPEPAVGGSQRGRGMVASGGRGGAGEHPSGGQPRPVPGRLGRPGGRPEGRPRPPGVPEESSTSTMTPPWFPWPRSSGASVRARRPCLIPCPPRSGGSESPRDPRSSPPTLDSDPPSVHAAGPPAGSSSHGSSGLEGPSLPGSWWDQPWDGPGAPRRRHLSAGEGGPNAPPRRRPGPRLRRRPPLPYRRGRARAGLSGSGDGGAPGGEAPGGSGTGSGGSGAVLATWRGWPREKVVAPSMEAGLEVARARRAGWASWAARWEPRGTSPSTPPWWTWAPESGWPKASSRVPRTPCPSWWISWPPSSWFATQGRRSTVWTTSRAPPSPPSRPSWTPVPPTAGGTTRWPSGSTPAPWTWTPPSPWPDSGPPNRRVGGGHGSPLRARGHGRRPGEPGSAQRTGPDRAPGGVADFRDPHHIPVHPGEPGLQWREALRRWPDHADSSGTSREITSSTRDSPWSCLPGSTGPGRASSGPWSWIRTMPSPSTTWPSCWGNWGHGLPPGPGRDQLARTPRARWPTTCAGGLIITWGRTRRGTLPPGGDGHGRHPPLDRDRGPGLRIRL